MPDRQAYDVCVEGHLDAHWAGVLDVALAHRSDGTTALRAVVRDQAELHGLLDRLRDLGVELVSVVRDPPTPIEQVGRAPRPRA
jgi:hypothetical protein